MDISSLRYPKKSHRKIVTLPRESIKLAELMGILAGDGGIGNAWQAVVSLNSQKDKDYVLYVKSLLENLFGISVIHRKRPNQNNTTVIITSTTAVDFLISKGMTRGDKIRAKIAIPPWVKENKSYLIHFIRGLFDTDGCLYLHRHIVKGKFYLNIGFCFTSHAKNLLFSFAQALKKFDIQPHITDHEQRIYLYAERDVVKYLNIFGSSNPRIYNLYNQWRDSRAV